MARWYLKDILPPVIAAVATVSVARMAFAPLRDGIVGISTLALIGLATLGAAALTSPFVRRLIVQNARAWSV